MIQIGCTPDDESYNLVIELLLMKNQLDSALKYLDILLKSGYMLSLSVFTEYVHTCVNTGRLDSLAKIIEKCKTTDQNKALCPAWKFCNFIADVAMQADHNEGLVVSALGTAGRTFNSDLLDASWSVMNRSLRKKRAPNPETSFQDLCICISRKPETGS